ncbi:hypothetical protein MIMGU_mgv1a017364mg [Erythranthe guttata]|uniref:Secreted protein n=1 Tax=Erythranthe guttata TaxID=4155 RepID=A0A022QFY6_ERYGU|nr:hypothetical protein MIMGU_mgv1a017364mg [Erythranthe guttata]
MRYPLTFFAFDTILFSLIIKNNCLALGLDRPAVDRAWLIGFMCLKTVPLPRGQHELRHWANRPLVSKSHCHCAWLVRQI